MRYTVVPSVWPVAGRSFRRGDTVTDDILGPAAGSYLRLGLITPTDSYAGSKKELVEQAKLAGVDVPKGATKADIVDLLKEHHGV